MKGATCCSTDGNKDEDKFSSEYKNNIPMKQDDSVCTHMRSRFEATDSSNKQMTIWISNFSCSKQSRKLLGDWFHHEKMLRGGATSGGDQDSELTLLSYHIHGPSFSTISHHNFQWGPAVLIVVAGKYFVTCNNYISKSVSC